MRLIIVTDLSTIDSLSQHKVEKEIESDVKDKLYNKK